MKLKRLTKRVVQKPDGRYLIYYEVASLPRHAARPAILAKRARPGGASETPMP